MVEWNRLIKYAIVGASGVVVNTVILYALTEYIGLYYLISAIIASETSILNNFFWNDNWTFSQPGSKHSIWNRLLIYNGISVFGTAILIAIMYLLTEHFDIYYIYANWGGVAIVFVVNYILNKRITWVHE